MKNENVKSLNNKKEKEKTKKLQWSDYVVLGIYICLSAFLIYLICDTFVKLSHNELPLYANKLIQSFVTSLILTFIYMILTILENKNLISFPQWLKICFYLFLAIAIVIYPFFGLYTIKAYSILICISTGLILSILSVSFFYNYLKDSNKQVKAKPSIVLVFSTIFSLSLSFVIKLFSYLIRLMFNYPLQTFGDVALDVLYIFLGAIVLNLMFYMSLKGNKKFINNCLIYIGKNSK